MFQLNISHKVSPLRGFGFSESLVLAGLIYKKNVSDYISHLKDLQMGKCGVKKFFSRLSPVSPPP